jgi:alanyl-tRNA synthetase
VRYGRDLGIRQNFCAALSAVVMDIFTPVYPEITDKRATVAEELEREEEKFARTLERGLREYHRLADSLKAEQKTVIPGPDAFHLFDTFGFPLALTVEIANEEGLSVDEAGFEAAMQEQRERSRGQAKGLALHEDGTLAALVGKTEFSGHERDEAEAVVRLILKDERAVEQAGAGEEVGIVLDSTPFYAERGGQVGDTGFLDFDGGEFWVRNTLPLGEGTVHVGAVKAGELKVGDTVKARVEFLRRDDIRRNHTATHLLQAALRKVLRGGHVAQSGSHVAPDRLRFDFSHHEAVSAEGLRQAEDLVNLWIMEDQEVRATEMTLEEAKQAGATALFGEKYGDVVRAVSVVWETSEGPVRISMELCGGTHTRRTGEIGSFRILHEGSVAAGIRRIEAVTGRGALDHARHSEAALMQVANALACNPEEAPERVERLHKRIGELEAEVKAAREVAAGTNLDDLLAAAQEVKGVKLVAASVPGANRDSLAALADRIVEKLGGGVAILGSSADGKVVLVCKADGAAVKAGAHAGNLI